MSVIKEEYMLPEITRHDLLPLSFLKKSVYTGSRNRLRYRIAKVEMGEEPDKRKVLRVSTWTTPFAFDHTPGEEITEIDFEFTDPALDEIVLYLNERLKESNER